MCHCYMSSLKHGSVTVRLIGIAEINNTIIQYNLLSLRHFGFQIHRQAAFSTIIFFTKDYFFACLLQFVFSLNHFPNC